MNIRTCGLLLLSIVAFFSVLSQTEAASSEYNQIVPTSDPSVVATASSSSPDSDPNNLVLGTGAWNSGNYGRQWVEINLGMVYNLTNISITINALGDGGQTKDLTASFQVYAGLTTDPSTIIFNYAGLVDSDEQFNFYADNFGARYIRISTDVVGSWAALEKVSIRDNVINGTGVQIVPTNSSAVTGTGSTPDGTTSAAAVIAGTGPWNAQQYGDQWIQINLGEVYDITKIVLVTDQFDGHTTNLSSLINVYAGRTTNTTELVYYFSGYSVKDQVFTADNLDIEARYIRIHHFVEASWSAWKSIFIYA